MRPAKAVSLEKDLLLFLCVSGMTHILSVKVRPRVFVAKCSKPQAEGREAGVKEAV